MGGATQRAHIVGRPYDEDVESSNDEVSVRRILLGFPEGSSVERIEFSEDGSTLTLWTRDVGPLLGRRGTTAERLRTGIEHELHRSVQLMFGELPRPDA